MPNWKKLIVSGSDASLSKLSILNTSTDDSLLIQSDENTSTAAPVITLKRNSATPADSDYLGRIKFKGENDADQGLTYAQITAKIQDASDGSEDGLIEFTNKQAGSNVITARLKSDKLQLLNGTDLEVDGGSISGSTYYGDGSNLTNVNATVSETTTVSDSFTSQTSVTSTHNFGTKNVIVTVYNSSDEMIIPASVTSNTNNVVTTYDSSTSGRVVVAKGGHVVSGSVQSIANQRDSSQLQTWAGSQAQYDALGSYDSNILYFVT